MADQLYLSLWFPNFRLDTLPTALASVMRQLAQLSPTPDGKRVYAAAAYPIAFSEAPTYQRLYVNDERSEDTADSVIETAIAEACESLHDDMAYEFEMRWRLWLPEKPADGELSLDPSERLDTLWRPTPTTVKIIGFGPEFDSSSFEQNGHVRVDFGLDFPWVLDEDDEDSADDDDSADEDDDTIDHEQPARSNLLSFDRSSAARRTDLEDDAPDRAQYIQRNIELLLAFTLSVEKHCGISSRLLWTESGEPLAAKLISRLQRLH